MRTALMVVLLLGIPVAATGQVSIGVRGGASVPYGDFAESEGENVGSADIGYTGGIEASIWLPFPGLSAIVSADAFVNAFDPNTEEFPAGTEFELGNHLTIPVLAGLRFAMPIAPTFRVFFTGQGGIAWYRPPSLDVTSPFGDFTAEFDPESKFGFSVGAGISFLNRFEAGIRAYPLGKYEFETETSDGSEMSGELDVSFIGITAGLRF